MSAGGKAEVLTTDLKKTYSLARAFARGKDVSKESLTLRVNGERSDGWKFFSKNSNGQHDIFLRRSLDEAIGTAEYVQLTLPRNGEEELDFIQAVLIQNDNDYKGRGNDRFSILPHL